MKSAKVRTAIILIWVSFLLISALPATAAAHPSEQVPGSTNSLERLIHPGPFANAANPPIYLPVVHRSLIGQYPLTIWNQWPGNYYQEYLDVLADFQASHPNVSIVVAKPDDLYAALNVAIPAGQGPDIVAWANDRIGALASDGFIVPLNPYFSMSYLISSFEPAAMNGNTWKGQVWGIPDTQEGIAFVYNKALIGSSELPNPDDFADLQNKAQQFENANPGKYYLCNQGLGTADAYHAAPVYFGFGINQYVDENGVVYMNTQESLNAANWIKDFRPYGMAEASYDICNSGLINGNIAAWWTGPWSIAELQSHGVDFGIASMGRPFVGIRNYMLTVNAVSRGNTPAVIALLNYLSSPAVQKRLALVNKTIPANTAALNDPAVQADWSIAGFGDALHRGTPMGPTPYTACQWAAVGEATLSTWNGTKTPNQAMNDAQTAIETCVAGMN